MITERENGEFLGDNLHDIQNYKEVTKNEFYGSVGQLDVTVNVRGNFPYTTLFCLRNREIKGKVIEKYAGENNTYPLQKKFYIKK